MDGADPVEQGRPRRADVRVRLPRRQLRHRSLPDRGAEAREEWGGEVDPMATKQLEFLAGLCFLLALAVTASAHHAFNAEFDPNKPVKFHAKVTKMLWVNPHVWIYVDVKKPDDSVEEWMIEAGTPNTLMRRGFTKESLQDRKSTRLNSSHLGISYA